MLFQPIDAVLQGACTVLICGVGGGYDVVCGLPLALAFQARGVRVHFANLTFTPLAAVRGGIWHTPLLLEVTPEADGPDYFPKKWLLQWWHENVETAATSWCFRATGAKNLTESYAVLVEKVRPDAILAIDGGVDSLLRGDEHSLGTPLWDALSLLAIEAQDVGIKILVTTAFGAERWDKIAHSEAFERIADLERTGAFLGAESLTRIAPNGRRLLEAVEWINSQQPNGRGSIVVSSMLSALRGEFGERPVNNRTLNTPIWISPLLALFWYFDLESVNRSKWFLDVLRPTETLEEAGLALGKWVDGQRKQAWREIPI